MSKLRKLGALALAAILTLSLTACGSSKSSDTTESGTASSEETIKVGLELKTLDGAFFNAFADLYQQACDEKGWELTILNANGDTMKESENMDTLISQGVDLIFIDPYETDGCVAAINKAVDAGIPVISVDNAAGDAANVVTIVYPDNVNNGLLCGAWVAEHDFPDNAVINATCMGGQKGLEAARERRMGFIAGVLKYRLNLSDDEAIEQATTMEQELIDNGSVENEEANFNILGIGWGNYAENEGLSAAEDLISAHGDMNLMFGENDAMLLGAETALENAGLTDQVKLAADADGQKEALELIKNGSNYVCTGDNRPLATVNKSMEIAEQILVDGADPTSFDRKTLTDPAAINADNIDEFYDENAIF